MDPTEATLYGAIIAGVFALLGVAIERLLRFWGRLRCYPSCWKLEFLGPEDSWEGTQEYPYERASEAIRAQYRFTLDLFNGMQEPYALRELKVAIILDDQASPLTDTPRDVGPGMPYRLSTGGPYNPLDVINVPPRQFVHKNLMGEFGKEEVSVLASGSWRRVEFVGKRPKRPLLWRKTYRKTITKP
jgi:hypothetical protein